MLYWIKTSSCVTVEKFQQFHIQQWIPLTDLCDVRPINFFLFLNYHEDEVFSVSLSVQLLTAWLCFPGRANRGHVASWPFIKFPFRMQSFKLMVILFLGGLCAKLYFCIVESCGPSSLKSIHRSKYWPLKANLCGFLQLAREKDIFSRGQFIVVDLDTSSESLFQGPILVHGLLRKSREISLTRPVSLYDYCLYPYILSIYHESQLHRCCQVIRLGPLVQETVKCFYFISLSL